MNFIIYSVRHVSRIQIHHYPSFHNNYYSLYSPSTVLHMKHSTTSIWPWRLVFFFFSYYLIEKHIFFILVFSYTWNIYNSIKPRGSFFCSPCVQTVPKYFVQLPNILTKQPKNMDLKFSMDINMFFIFWIIKIVWIPILTLTCSIHFELLKKKKKTWTFFWGHWSRIWRQIHKIQNG